MTKQMPSKTKTVRRLDNVGRVSLPPKFINYLDLTEGDTVLVYLNEEKKIVLKKYPTGCVFCGNEEDVVKVSDFEVCSNCRKQGKNAMVLVKNRYEKQDIPSSRRMVIPFKIRNDLGLHIERKESKSEKTDEPVQKNDKLTLELHEGYILLEKYEEE